MINSVTLEGRLVAPPMLNQTTKGDMVAGFTIVNNYKKDGAPAFLRCKVFGRSAEWLNNAIKGDRIIVSGKLIAYEYESKKTGKIEKGFEILVDHYSRDYKPEFKTNNPPQEFQPSFDEIPF